MKPLHCPSLSLSFLFCKMEIICTSQDYYKDERGIYKIPKLVSAATAAAMIAIMFTLTISLLATYRVLS